MSSDAFEKRIRERDAFLKNEHDKLLKKVYHDTFLLYQEGKIEEINKIIIPKLVEIGDSSLIASIASDFPKCDINALTMVFINSKPFLEKSSKIYDLFTFVTEENIDKINFNFIVSTILSCSFNDLFFEIRLALDFINEYNNRFTKEQLDLILTRLICKIQDVPDYVPAYLLYSDIVGVPRMNFDLILSGVLLNPNPETVIYFAKHLNYSYFYKLMDEVKKRNQKKLMDYFYKYYFESIYFASSDDFIYVLFIFGNEYINRYLQYNQSENYETLHVKSLKIKKKLGELNGKKEKNNK